MKIKNIEDLKKIKKEYLDDLSRYKYRVLVCGGTGCVSSGHILGSDGKIFS